MRHRFVLDSFAVLTYLKEEPGWQKVRNILWDAANKKNIVYFNYVNLGEVYYIACREKGMVPADRALAAIKLWPVNFVGVQENLAVIAGRIKAENKLSYADAYVAATALSKKAAIVTGDREFKSVEDLLQITWLPANH